ncbi:MAG: agmatine deiminase family protein [Myxococcota bacterium]
MDSPLVHMPAEWAPHASCFTAFPHLAGEWGPDLEPARRELVALCRALVDPDPSSGVARGEAVDLVVSDEAHERLAREWMDALPVRYHRLAFGDIWLRDIAPVFVRDAHGREAALVFHFNGWGGKYALDGDDGLAARLAAQVGVPARQVDLVCEGGALEVDGEGTCLTTRDCLLHPNRNPGRSEAEVTATLQAALGVERVIWLEGALARDHTDGHIDTLARFVAPGVVLCMEPGTGDPNRDVLEGLLAQLRTVRDARGRRLDVVTMPSPGAVLDGAGRPMPASYCNYYVGNTVVAVPTYGSPYDETAVQRIARLFPGRRTVGLSSRAILTGGGALHCITQQRPAGAGMDAAP